MPILRRSEKGHKRSFGVLLANKGAPLLTAPLAGGNVSKQAAAIWYQRMARTVARRGVQKSPAQTPQEFVRKIEDSRLRGPVSRFTNVYESARFGNSTTDAKRLPELYEEVELATKGK